MCAMTGGNSAPSLDLDLEAEGVKAMLTATMSLKGGRTKATFANLPDVPIARLAITLPAGARSLLGSIENVCSRPLQMPYRLVSQGGGSVTGSTRVLVKGCAKSAKRSSKPRRARGK